MFDGGLILEWGTRYVTFGIMMNDNSVQQILPENEKIIPKKHQKKGYRLKQFFSKYICVDYTIWLFLCMRKSLENKT